MLSYVETKYNVGSFYEDGVTNTYHQ